MKLEPKHILLYLQHKLRVEVLDYKSDYVGNRYDTIVGVHQWDKEEKYWGGSAGLAFHCG